MEDKSDIFSKLSKREKAALGVGAGVLAVLLASACLQTAMSFKTYRLLTKTVQVTEQQTNRGGIIWANSDSSISQSIESQLDGSISQNEEDAAVVSSSSQSASQSANKATASSQAGSAVKTTASSTANAAANVTTTARPSQMTYVINTNSKKIHSPNCSSAINTKEENKKTVVLSDAEFQQYLNDGYTVCSRCNAGR